MSQAKVDRYKQEKANRAKILKREKRIAVLEKSLVALVCAAIVFWIGFSIYNYDGSASTDENAETVTAEVNLNPIYNFYSDLSALSE